MYAQAALDEIAIAVRKCGEVHAKNSAVRDDENLRGYFDGLNQNAAKAVVEEIAKLRNNK